MVPDYVKIEPYIQNSSFEADIEDTFNLSERLGEIEHKLLQQPAKIYDLAVLSSLLARCNVKNLTKETAEQIAEMYSVVTAIIENSVKPDVVHNDPVLVQKSLSFLDRIINLSESVGLKLFLATLSECVSERS